MSTPREPATPPADAASQTNATAPRKPHGDLEDYHRIADTIGGVPNLRWKDNLFQLICVAVFAVVGGLLGWLRIPGKDISAGSRIAMGTLGGLILGTLLSGLVLMALGWIRSGRKKK